MFFKQFFVLFFYNFSKKDTNNFPLNYSTIFMWFSVEKRDPSAQNLNKNEKLFKHAYSVRTDGQTDLMK